MPDDAAYLLCAEDATAAFFGAAAAAGSACTGADDDDDDADGSCCSAGEEESAASIAELIGGEADYSPRPDYPDRLRSRAIDPAARAESVAWILKVTQPLARPYMFVCLMISILMIDTPRMLPFSTSQTVLACSKNLSL
jgi:cyclin D1/2/4, plant